MIECGESGFVATRERDDDGRDATLDSDPIAAQASTEVLKRIRESTKPLSMNTLRVAISSIAGRHETEMQQSGWLRSASERSGLFSLAATFAVGLLAIGFVRCTQGLSAGRPIGFLLLEMIAAGCLFAFTGWSAMCSRMTTAGKQLVERHRVKFSRAKLPSIERSSMIDDANLPFIALWGGVAALHLWSDPTDEIVCVAVSIVTIAVATSTLMLRVPPWRRWVAGVIVVAVGVSLQNFASFYPGYRSIWFIGLMGTIGYAFWLTMVMKLVR